jgi:hypothetical protein
VGPRSDLDAVKKKYLPSAEDRTLSLLPIAPRYTDSAIIVERRIILERN